MSKPEITEIINEDTGTIEEEIVDLTQAFRDFYADFIGWLPSLAVGLIILVLSFVAARVVRSVVRRAMAKTSTEGHVGILVAQIAYIGTFTVGIIAALAVIGVDLGALLASLGLAGFAIGFAMKDILGNFLSGIIVLSQRPFTIGDYVVIGDVEGTVTNIRTRDTQITTFDGKLVYIPNNTLSTSNIVNLTALPHRMVAVDVGIAYGSDITRAIEACLAAVDRVGGFVNEPAPEVLVTGFADSAVMLQVRVWVDWKNEPFLGAKSKAHQVIKEALDDAGIEIPFPVRTVYFRQNGNLEKEIGEIIVDKAGKNG